MRRPPIACPRAAQPLQSSSLSYVYVSDHLLDSAFSRLFRRRCPYQKRHGSHVPGPLEARRRAAKRRLTAQASTYPQHSLPPSFSLGALLGLRSTPQPSFTYEPPTPSKTSCGIPPHLLVEGPARWLPNRFDNPQAADSPSMPPQTLEQIKHDAKVQIELSDLDTKPEAENVETCFLRFKELLKGARKDTGKDDTVFLQHCIQTCQPGVDNPGKFALLVLRYLKDMQWDPTSIVACLYNPSVVLPHLYSHEGHELLVCLEELRSAMGSSQRIKRIGRLYQRLTQGIIDNPNSQGPVPSSTLKLLIRGLWDSGGSPHSLPAPVVLSLRNLVKLSAPMVQAHLDPVLSESASIPDQVSSLVIACTMQSRLPCEIIEVLNHMPPALLRFHAQDIVFAVLKPKKTKSRHLSVSPFRRIRIKTLFELLHGIDNGSTTMPEDALLTHFFFNNIGKHALGRNNNSIPPGIFIQALLYRTSSHYGSIGISQDKWNSFIESQNSALEQSERTSKSLNEMLTKLMTEMERISIPTSSILKLVLPMIHQFHGIESALDFLRRLERRGSTIADATLSDDVVAQALKHSRHLVKASTESERQHQARLLHACQQIQAIQQRLSARARAHGKELEALQALRKFQHILDRAHDARILPLRYRKLTADISWETRVELIHQFAHQYSMDYTRNHLQGWRSIFYLYKYLRIYGLPIGTLFSKAVVRTCITRPMSENRFVSTRRAVWVCNMVARVEGPEVAQRVEHNFWIWRGDLIYHAKRTLVACGVMEGKAHVNTLKKFGMI